MLKRDTSAAGVIDTLLEDDLFKLSSSKEAPAIISRFGLRLFEAQSFTMSHEDLLELVKNMEDRPCDEEVSLPFSDIYMEYTGGTSVLPADVERVGMFYCGSNSDGNPSIFMVVHYRDGTVVCPAVGTVHCKKPVFACSSRVPDDRKDFVIDQATAYAVFTGQVMWCLTHGGVRTYTPSAVRRQKRMAHRKRTKANKVLEYKVLKLDLSNPPPEASDCGGTHASPRLHLRRGHWRKYKSGIERWIKPTWVGDKDLGVIHKDYEVTT